MADGADDALALRARLIPIDDPDDPRIAEFRDIRERALRGRNDLFIAEGAVVLRILSAVHGTPAGVRAKKVLVLDNRLDGVREILAGFPSEVPVMTAPRRIMDRIVGFPIHRGVLAVGERAAQPALAELVAGLPAQALVVVASAISNHDNVGALFRNAVAFGGNAVILDGLCCDPLYRKAIRVSVGAALKMPFAHGGDVADILATLARADFAVWGLSPRGDTPIEEIPAAERIALVVGTEGGGLPPDLMATIRTARVAQAPGLDSLNLATAAGITLHSLARGTGRLS